MLIYTLHYMAINQISPQVFYRIIYTKLHAFFDCLHLKAIFSHSFACAYSKLCEIVLKSEKTMHFILSLTFKRIRIYKKQIQIRKVIIKTNKMFTVIFIF